MKKNLIVLGCDKLVIFPLFPQFSAVTNASIFDEVNLFYQLILCNIGFIFSLSSSNFKNNLMEFHHLYITYGNKSDIKEKSFRYFFVFFFQLPL